MCTVYLWGTLVPWAHYIRSTRGTLTGEAPWAQFPPNSYELSSPLALERHHSRLRLRYTAQGAPVCSSYIYSSIYRHAGVGVLPPHEGPEPGYTVVCSYFSRHTSQSYQSESPVRVTSPSYTSESPIQVCNYARNPSPEPPASIGPKLKPTPRHLP